MTTPILTYPPNWAQTLTESLEWLTDVQTAWDGSEVRRKARLAPRRALDYLATVDGYQRQLMRSWLSRYQAQDVIAPIWTDGYSFATSGNSGTDFAFELIPVPDAQLLDYEVGARFVIFHGDGTTSTGTVTSVGESNITFTGDEIAWSAHDTIYPARLGRLDAEQGISMLSGAVEDVPIRVIYIDPTTDDGADWVTQYRGVDVLDLQPNRARPIDASMFRLLNTVDFLTGKYSRFDRAGRSFVGASFEHILEGRQEIKDFRRLLLKLSGRLGSFWCPTWQADMYVIADIGAAATTIDIRPISYADAYLNIDGRRDIAIRTRSGNTYYRRITASESVSATVERLTIDYALGDAVSVADVVQVSFLDIVRLATDDLSIEWISAGIARVDIGVRGLKGAPVVDVGVDISVSAIAYPTVQAGLGLEFFDWLQETHSPTWLQPLDEASGATVTSGMAGPDSSSVTSVTFGEPGLVESDRTAALFNTSRIVFPKGAVLDRMHQAAGGTFMFWAQADALMDDVSYTIFASNGSSTTQVGILVSLEDRYSAIPGISKNLRVAITIGELGLGVYESIGASAFSPNNVVTPGHIQHFAFTHSDVASELKMYVDGEEVSAFGQRRPYSASTSTADPTVGALRPSDILLPHKGLLQGLTFIPSILTPAQISEIYTRSGI